MSKETKKRSTKSKKEDNDVSVNDSRTDSSIL